MAIREMYAYNKGNMKPPKPTTKGFRHPYQHLSWKNAWPWHTWNYTRPTCRSIITTSPRDLRWCDSSCHPILNNNQGFGITWRTLLSWVRNITQRLQPPPMNFFGYKNPVPQRQACTPTNAVTSVHSNNAERRNTVPGKDEISLSYVMCYLCQEMVSYAGKCL